MKKLLIVLTFFLLLAASKANAQAITDTASLRAYINTNIVTNASGGITAVKMNTVLNGIATLMKSYAIDSGYWLGPDTLVLTRRGGYSSFKIKIAISPAGSETDPTVSAAAKSISSGDITNWNSKQPAITNSSTVSIVANVINAANTTALWNANQIQGRPMASTAPTTSQVIGWNGSSWVPMDQTGGAGGITNLDTARSAATVTIQPSGGGSVAIIKAVDQGSNKAGIVTPSMKTSWDSAWTKTAMLNDSIRVWYNTQGQIVHRDTLFSFSFVKSLEALGLWGAQLKNDQESPGANKVYGTDGSGVKGWKADPAGGSGLSGLTTTRVPYATSSTTIGDDAGMTYDAATNQLNVDSIKLASNISLQRMLINLGGGIASDSIGFGACVIRPTASGGSGSLIAWAFIDDADHTKTYFTAVQGNPSGASIHLSFPKINKVLSLSAVPDEALAGRGIFLGSSVMDTAADIYVYQHIISSGYLQGNGTNFTVNGSLTAWTTNYNSGTGAVSFTPPGNLYYNTASDASHMSANYSGTNNYRLRRKVSGLGSDIAGWVMVDNVTNTDVTGAPTTSDIVEITGLPFYRQVSAYQVSGSLYEASIWSVNSNVWIFFTYKK